MSGGRTPVTASAGWYPQPDGQLRYWDGRQWTEHFAPGGDRAWVQTPGADRAVGPEVTGSALAPTRSEGHWATGVAGWGGLGLAVLIGALSSGLGGAFAMFGVFALVVALTTLARGGVRWAHLRNRRSGIVALVGAMTALALAGTTAAPIPTSKTNSRPNTALTLTPSTAPNTVGTTPPAAVTAPSPKPSASPTAAPTKRASPEPTEPVVVTAAGVVLPNSARTPGATNPSVTQATIGRTICVTGWTDTVRPPSSLTTALKEQQLASGYAYRGDQNTPDYEEDHLISLELGGSPSSPSNLWPEPYNSTEGARVKDVLENKLHALVCTHSITLVTAQRAIATNWWTAYLKYDGTATTTQSQSGSTPKSAPAPVSPSNGATALCQDGTYSYAAHHQGACSHHGGVEIFYK